MCGKLLLWLVPWNIIIEWQFPVNRISNDLHWTLSMYIVILSIISIKLILFLSRFSKFCNFAMWIFNFKFSTWLFNSLLANWLFKSLLATWHFNSKEPVKSFPGMFWKMEISLYMILEGLQYGFGELYWRTKPRGVRNDFFILIFKNSYKTYKV